MRTYNAYRQRAWRCPSCGLTCQCLADHRDCRNLAPRYGHHARAYLVTPADQIELAARLGRHRLRRFAGE